MNPLARDVGRLLVKAPDVPGIVAGVSVFLRAHDANIMESAQHTTDPNRGTFFLRVTFERPELHETLPRRTRISPPRSRARSPCSGR